MLIVFSVLPAHLAYEGTRATGESSANHFGCRDGERWRIHFPGNGRTLLSTIAMGCEMTPCPRRTTRGKIPLLVRQISATAAVNVEQ
jgi:hypothetical protein